MSFISHQFYHHPIYPQKKDSRSVVFIDSQLPNSAILAQQVTTLARVIIIGSEDNGVKAISNILQTSSCGEIHIFATGTPGCIRLGSSELSINTLETYRLVLQNWFNNCNLGDSQSNKIPHLWLYGCNVAAGDVGEEFITKLGNMTQAKITATASTTESHILSEV